MDTKCITSFPPELFIKVNHYVYRLIDPRDGSTFYVGQGVDNRVFSHIDEARKGLASAELEISDKLKTIREILAVGLDPIHVIHRHGMTQDEANEVEAALIDVFPGLTNEQGGIGSVERGPAHVAELVQQYGAKEMEFLPTDKLLLIKINKTIEERGSIYEAVRHAWNISIERANNAEYVLAIDRGICKGAFKPTEKWMPATCKNFPTRTVSMPERCGFIGVSAPEYITERFLGKRIPKNLVKKGKANPCEYVGV